MRGSLLSEESWRRDALVAYETSMASLRTGKAARGRAVSRRSVVALRNFTSSITCADLSFAN